MISQKEIKDLEFEDDWQFFDYVVESKINGNYAQTKDFIKRMSNGQFKSFLFHIKQMDHENLNEEFLYMRCDL